MTPTHIAAPSLLTRERLIDRLEVAVTNRITVIAAPAGYGKSTLVEQWLAQHDGADTLTLSLGPHGDLEQASASLRAARRHKRRAVLVVDDVDAARDEQLVHELTSVALDVRLPLSIILTSRSPYARALRPMLGRSDVTVVDAADLAFTRDEARELVNDVASVDLDDAMLECLLTRTHGWAVGVHGAATHLRTAADPRAYIATLDGAERHVSGFFLAEVLLREPPLVQRFLLETSPLDRLTGPLCDAVTAGRGGATMLRRLERSGMFVQQLPNSKDWFSYHPMFREFLRAELRRTQDADERVLLRRASAWYSSHDDAEAAALSSIEAEDWQGLIALADAWGQRLFESGRVAEVLHWLDALPAPQHRLPSVTLRRAVLHTMLGETAQAAQTIHDLETHQLSMGEAIAANALRATWGFFDALPASTVHAGDAALRGLADVDPNALPNVFGLTDPTSLVMMAGSSRARALWYLGDIKTARRALYAGIKHRDAYPPWLVNTLTALATLEAWAGNLRAARLHGMRAVAVGRRAGLLEHPAVLDARLALAHVSRERGNQERARHLVDEMEAIAACSRRPYTTAVIAIERARWQLAAGVPEEVLGVLDRYRAGSDVMRPPILEAHLQAVESALLLAFGDADRADLVAASASGASICPDLAAAGVHAAVARGDLVAAGERLDQWIVNDDQPRHRLLHDLWRAVVDFEAGDRRRAIQLVSGVVGVAEAEGHVRLFLDGGRPVERLLRALVHAAPLPYAERLVHLANESGDPARGTVLGLSKRELEVARYLPTPLSSAEIAERLYISLNTLKTHLRTIYGKLGASNRREAIQRAEELGIA